MNVWPLLLLGPAAVCALACDPCPKGEYLYPMCSSASTRACKRCVAGESWCPDGIWAHACSACAGALANCTVLADTVCNGSTTVVPNTTSTTVRSTTTAATTKTSLLSTTKLRPKPPTTPVSLRMLRPAEAPMPEASPPTTEAPPPVLPTPSRPNEPLIVAVVAAVALGVVLVLYCFCSPRQEQPGRVVSVKLK